MSILLGVANKRTKPMPGDSAATKRLQIPVDDAEFELVKRKAGKLGIAGLVRQLLGLAEREKGRKPAKQAKR